MTIDEAIKHCLEVAEKEEQFCVQDDRSCLFQKSHAECAADHRQLAEWLTELKELRQKEKARYTYNKALCLVWQAMKNRCYNPKSESYKNYGARGIEVCKEWQDRENFTIWAINNGYKKGLQLDRIDNNGNYEPNNCRWVTPKENSRNRRNTIVLTVDNKDYYVSDLCKMLNLKTRTVYKWIERHDKQFAENKIKNLLIGND